MDKCPLWMRTARDDALEMARALQPPSVQASDVDGIVDSLRRLLGDETGGPSLSHIAAAEENEPISGFDAGRNSVAVDRHLGHSPPQSPLDLGGGDLENLAGTIPQFELRRSDDNDSQTPRPAPMPSVSDEITSATRQPVPLPSPDLPTSPARKSNGPIELLANAPAGSEMSNAPSESRSPLEQRTRDPFSASSASSFSNDGSMSAQREQRDFGLSAGVEPFPIDDGLQEQDRSSGQLDDGNMASRTPPAEDPSAKQLASDLPEVLVARLIVMVSVMDAKRFVDATAITAAETIARRAREIIRREIDDDNYIRNAQLRALYWEG